MGYGLAKWSAVQIAATMGSLTDVLQVELKENLLAKLSVDNLDQTLCESLGKSLVV
jgi:uncharacterized protein involved in propanediol utilization